ncbi:MAG: LUD domain-containing protein, partial [Phyllobacteriaceae bacterium]|nr:LUD domain-containing protein [Phyllobacteriaceae bacterium]
MRTGDLGFIYDNELFGVEGNGRMVTTLPPLHVAITGIEKVVPTLEDIATLIRLLLRLYSHQQGSIRIDGQDVREVRPGGAVAEFEERFAKRLPLREKHSKLGAFWHTELGTLNQVIHVWPYEDLQHRMAVRMAMANDAELAQVPGGRDLIVAQESEIMTPAPFMH